MCEKRYSFQGPSIRPILVGFFMALLIFDSMAKHDNDLSSRANCKENAPK